MARKRRIGIGHNGGPPLREKRHVPPWGKGGIGQFFTWKAKHRAAWRPASTDILLSRQARAEALGLTYEEYTLEILERGRYLQATDEAAIAAIRLRRGRRPRRHL
ncbi:MAG: hypothetical protein O9322_05470 [Beijerinckiaceae bacterium]|nr:hypothetical protein [Beijerinckiaceae bacterium]MCZ8298972.1 hypothetical protein [Beijerinckiaceae bacterium]